MGLSGGPAAGRADKPAAGAVRQERVTDRVRMEELVEQWRREPWVAVLALPSLDVVAVAWDGGARAALCAADRLEGTMSCCGPCSPGRSKRCPTMSRI